MKLLNFPMLQLNSSLAMSQFIINQLKKTFYSDLLTLFNLINQQLLQHLTEIDLIIPLLELDARQITLILQLN
jgi:hypothetical protein